MMTIDPTTDVGKVRLRIGDWGDFPFLPDSVITATLTDKDGSVPQAAALCAQYILATLSFRTHKKIPQLEVWGAEAFTNYRKFLIDTVSNPAFMSYAPIPYGTGQGEEHPLIAFVNEWNESYCPPEFKV